MGLWYTARYPYSLAVSQTGARVIYNLLEGAPPPEILLKVEDGTFLLNTMVQTERGLRYKPLAVNMVHWNAILFLALVLVTPLRIVVRRWFLVLAGAAALFASQVTFFVISIYSLLGHIYMVEVGSLDEVWSWTPFAKKVMGFYGTIFNPIVPFLFYLPVFIFRPRGNRGEAD